MTILLLITLKFDLDMKAFHQFGLLRHKPSPLDLRESVELNDQTIQAIRSFKQQHWHAAKSAATNLTNSLEDRRAAVEVMKDFWWLGLVGSGAVLCINVEESNL